ncbi:MAG: hypothetical protein WBQ43_08380 [Terriglobales bacterium]
MKATAASAGPSPNPTAASEIEGTDFVGGDHSVLQGWLELLTAVIVVG